MWVFMARAVVLIGAIPLASAGTTPAVNRLFGNTRPLTVPTSISPPQSYMLARCVASPAWVLPHGSKQGAVWVECWTGIPRGTIPRVRSDPNGGPEEWDDVINVAHVRTNRTAERDPKMGCSRMGGTRKTSSYPLELKKHKRKWMGGGGGRSVTLTSVCSPYLAQGLAVPTDLLCCQIC